MLIVETLVGWWASPACRRVTSGAILAFAVLASSYTFLTCAPSVFDRSKFCFDDDYVEVHFSTGRLPLDCECLSASTLLQLLETDGVVELRVPELSREAILDNNPSCG